MSILVQVIDRAFQLFYIILLARIILSWIPIPHNQFTAPILSFVFDITEPVLKIFRGILPMIGIGGMGIDLSPILAILVLSVVRTLLVQLLILIGL